MTNNNSFPYTSIGTTSTTTTICIPSITPSYPNTTLGAVSPGSVLTWGNNNWTYVPPEVSKGNIADELLTVIDKTHYYPDIKSYIINFIKTYSITSIDNMRFVVHNWFPEYKNMFDILLMLK